MERRIKALAALALGALSLVGCQTSPVSKHMYRPYTLSSADQETVKAGVQSGMKDPSSATFGNMGAAISDAGVVQVCGTVNGKNGFGGYAGTQPYTGVLAANNAGKMVFVVTAIGADSAAGNLCRGAGIAAF